MRLYAGDIRVLSRNKQVISRIEEKFGTVESFAEKINMSPKTVRQYLNQNKEYTDNFLAFLTEHIGDYRSLFRTGAQQVEDLVEILTKDIYNYTLDKDIEILEKALKLATEYKLPRCITKCYRNMGMYYLNTGSYKVSLRFFNMAEAQSEQIRDADIECLITSEMITANTYLTEYRAGEKLSREFELLYKIENVKPFYRFWYYYSLGNLYISDKNYVCAKNVLNKALLDADTDYQKAKCLNQIGICYKKDGDFDKAEYYYKKSLECADTDISIGLCYNNLASLYMAKGLRQLAEENVNEALIYIRPEQGQFYIGLYQTYVEIYPTEESVVKFLYLLGNVYSSFKKIFMPYILEWLSDAIDKIKDIENIKEIIGKYIEQNELNLKIKGDLYMILGAIVYKREVKGK